MAMSKNKPVNDMTAFERQAGLHLSLGKKHNVFKKPGMKAYLHQWGRLGFMPCTTTYTLVFSVYIRLGIKSSSAKFHIDMFVDVQKITMDDGIMFENGKFVE